jgi:hypothetical protein
MIPPGPVAATTKSMAALSDTTICSLTALNEAISAGGTVDLVSL